LRILFVGDFVADAGRADNRSKRTARDGRCVVSERGRRDEKLRPARFGEQHDVEESRELGQRQEILQMSGEIGGLERASERR
jgi:hypothetical protein